MINSAVLSSRSEATLAAAWAVLHFLGEESYTELAKRLMSARSKIMRGLEEMGYKIMGDPTVPVAFTSEDINLFRLCDEVAKKGWLFLPQKGIPSMNIPPSVHLTITPIHDKVADLMISDLRACTEAVMRVPPSEVEGLLDIFGTIFGMLVPGEMDLATIGKLFAELEKTLSVYGERVLKTLGIEKGFPKEMAMIYELLATLPPEIAELLANYVVIEVFNRGI